MSTDSTSTFYDPVYEARKALREAGVGAPSLSERAARAPRQVMPRDEAPATPLSETWWGMSYRASRSHRLLLPVKG